MRGRRRRDSARRACRARRSRGTRHGRGRVETGLGARLASEADRNPAGRERRHFRRRFGGRVQQQRQPDRRRAGGITVRSVERARRRPAAASVADVGRRYEGHGRHPCASPSPPALPPPSAAPPAKHGSSEMSPRDDAQPVRAGGDAGGARCAAVRRPRTTVNGRVRATTSNTQRQHAGSERGTPALRRAARGPRVPAARGERRFELGARRARSPRWRVGSASIEPRRCLRDRWAAVLVRQGDPRLPRQLRSGTARRRCRLRAAARGPRAHQRTRPRACADTASSLRDIRHPIKGSRGRHSCWRLRTWPHP